LRFLEEKEVRERKDKLLQTVILEYIRTGHPVPSSIVSQFGEIKLSSATVRNLLHELEEEGYLTHPHTSAGRVPTDKGYRYYVDYLINLQEVLTGEQRQIENDYTRRIEEVEGLLGQTSRMLAYLSHYAGFVLRPKLETSQFQRIEFIPISEGKVLLVLVATNGFIRHKIIESPGELDNKELLKFGRWLNNRFSGKNLKEFCLEFANTMDLEHQEQEKNFNYLLKFLEDPLEDIGANIRDEELLMEGESGVLSSPEFALVPGHLRSLAEVLDNRKRLTQLIKKEMERAQDKFQDRVSVVIGNESLEPLLQDLSLVAKTFETKEHTVGFLGILGPKRMEYAQMMALVENMQVALQKSLNLWQGSGKKQLVDKES